MTYRFEITTDESVINQCNTNNAEAFNRYEGGLLTTEQHVAAVALVNRSEACQLRSPSTLIMGQVFYVMRDASQPNTANANVIASCTTLTREGYVKLGLLVHSVPVTCFSFVYTRPEYRGKGVAEFMLHEARQHVERENPTGFSILYSGVGEYYRRVGFESRAVPIWSLSVSSLLDTAVVEGGECTAVGDDAFGPLFAMDDLEMKLALRALPRLVVVALKPDSANQKLFTTRCRFVCAEATSVATNPDTLTFGWQVKHTLTKAVMGFVSVTHNWCEKLTTVTRLFIARAALGEALAVTQQLLQAAAIEAQRLGFESVKMWETDLPTAAAEWVATLAFSALRVNASCLPALCLHPEFKRLYGGSTASVEWYMNGKWGWH